jgi:hypothetical protein
VIGAFGLWLAVEAVRRRLRWDEERKRYVLTVAALMATYAFCIAYMVSPKTFLDHLPSVFGYIQLPWRLLAMTALLSMFALGIVMRAWPALRRAGPVLVAFAVVVVIVVPGIQRRPDLYGDLTGADIDRARAVRSGDRGYTVQGEYLPLEINPNDPEPSLVHQPEVRGRGVVRRWERDGDDRITATVDAEEPAIVVFPRSYYDVYRVRSDRDGELDTFNHRGLLAVRVPEGVSTLDLSRRLAPASWAGIGLTSAGLLVLIAVVWRRRRRADAPDEGAAPFDGGIEEPAEASAEPDRTLDAASPRGG